MFKTISECRVDLVANTLLRETVSRGVLYHSEDFMPCSAARVSFGREDKTGQDEEADRKLMSYLAKHQHMTPFEYQHATFLIECPLFIRSQIHRHRTFSYNEISRRYTSEDLEFWIPDKFRGQSKSNRQASSDEVITEYTRLTDSESIPTGMDLWEVYCEAHKGYLNFYLELLASGVAREIARSVLPQSLLTRFYMGGNLRNWVHFLQLRKDSHAQFEVRVIADKIEQKLKELWPESCNALGI